MTLDVFGIGFGRTGTESLKNALEILGQGPCYHMFEVLPYEERVTEWVRLAKGKAPEWDSVFEGYSASVDWPGAYFWQEIAEHFGDAKLILTIRDTEDWYRSMSNTILPLLKASSSDPESLANQMFIQRTFNGDIDDERNVKATFDRHNADVQAAFGPDRLLVYQLGSGWGPICDFLGLEVPDQPFPRGNSSREFGANIERLMAQRAPIREHAA